MKKVIILKNGIQIASAEMVNPSSWIDEQVELCSWGQLGEYQVQIEDIGDFRAIEKLRRDRNDNLNDCDWTQLPDAPLTQDQKNAWAVYRQALRDLPETVTDYNNIIWPVKP